MTYRPLSPAELNALELPDLEYLVDGIVPTGAFVELVAREKSGKSLMLIDMMVSIAAGEPFLDRAVQQGPTALVTMEDNIREARARLNARLNGIDDTPVYLLACDGSILDQRFSLEDGTSLDSLTAMIEGYGLVAVGIDPLRETHSLAENDSDDMAPLLRAPRQTAHMTNCAIVMTHHEGKAGTSRGSTSIDAAFDQIVNLKLTDPTADDLAGVLHIKGRFGPRQSIRAAFGEHGRWKLDTTILLPTNTRERIVDYLLSVGGWHSADAIHEGIGSKAISLKTIQNALGELLRADQVVRQGSGKRGDPFTYAAVGTSRLFPDESRTHQEQSNGLFPNPETLGRERFGNKHNGPEHLTCKACGASRRRGLACPACGLTDSEAMAAARGGDHAA